MFTFKYREPLGKPECPYAYRTMFIFFGYSIRIHQWIRSDDKRFMHDHPWWFITFVLKGSYVDISPNGEDQLNQFSFRYRKANYQHYVDVPKSGAVTILLTGKRERRWGFWINDKFKRPSKYFKIYGHPACDEQ